MNRPLKVVLAIVILLAVGGGSFYGGMVYGKSQAQSSFAALSPAGGGVFRVDGTPGALPGRGGAGAEVRRLGQGAGVFGEITEIGDGMLVLTANDGKQTQVRITDTTLIEKQASVQLSDLEQGETVMVSGTTDAEGVVTARSVQVAPAGRFAIGGPAAASTRTP